MDTWASCGDSEEVGSLAPGPAGCLGRLLERLQEEC